jgi:pheromone shutdown protein TraB
MIHVFGTSHISQESLELVEEKIEEVDPEVAALELDVMRLNSLLSDERNQRGGPLFIRALQYFQRSIGRKTGVMPGEEMLHAYRIAEQQDRDVALIDQDIRATIQKLKEVRFSEKLKAGAQLLVGMLLPGSFEIPTDIPEEEMIDDLLHEMSFKFPEMFRVLVEERNTHMTESLKMLADENDGDIAAFVGAAHKKEIERLLEEDGYAVSRESSVE